jgi:penicillin-binding protein 1A
MGENEQGATVPVPIWIDYMKTVLEGKPESMLERPDGIVDRLIDKQTGKVARPGQANTMFELFMQENAPTETETRGPNSRQNTTDEAPTIETFF